MVEALMIDGRALSPKAEEIISTLTDVLSAHVALIDLDEMRGHSRLSSSWYSHEVARDVLEGAALNPARNGVVVCVRLNRRWIVRVVGRGARVTDDGWIVASRAVPLSTEQVAFVERAAERLRPLLPATSKASDVPWPDGTSGGGSGSAELGIPVGWVRKLRN